MPSPMFRRNCALRLKIAAAGFRNLTMPRDRKTTSSQADSPLPVRPTGPFSAHGKSVPRFSSFGGAALTRMDTIAEEPDSQYLQVVSGEQEIGYSRLLGVVTPEMIRRRLPKGRLRTAELDGIENTFVGKASVVWYRSGSKWSRFSWSD